MLLPDIQIKLNRTGTHSKTRRRYYDLKYGTLQKQTTYYTSRYASRDDADQIQKIPDWKIHD
ncbi:hypothetical protein ACTXT7_002209 [Hymenolepis weldensis]